MSTHHSSSGTCLSGPAPARTSHTPDQALLKPAIELYFGHADQLTLLPRVIHWFWICLMGTGYLDKLRTTFDGQEGAECRCEGTELDSQEMTKDETTTARNAAQHHHDWVSQVRESAARDGPSEERGEGTKHALAPQQ